MEVGGSWLVRQGLSVEVRSDSMREVFGLDGPGQVLEVHVSCIMQHPSHPHPLISPRPPVSSYTYLSMHC